MRSGIGAWRIIALSTLFAASLACKYLPYRSIPSESGQAGKIIFQDDFSDPASGWNRAITPSGMSDYADGAYRIIVGEAFSDIWSTPELDLSDASIQVDAIKVGGERNNRFGIICRANGDQFYTFVISSDGYYGIGMIKGMEHTLIGMDAMQPSEAINQGSALNRLRADCNGETLSLYINDQLVEQVNDSDLTSGNVGLIAGTYETPGTDILFSNFIVREP